MATFSIYGIPTPETSVQSPTPSQTSSSTDLTTLPAQRHKPLKPGSAKEITLINYVDSRVLYITRRYATKYTNITTKAEEVPGYTQFDQFIKDLNPLIDLVWMTGTPNLEIPYLLQFAGMIASYMPAFPFTNNMFPLLRRLDIAFSTLLGVPPDSNSRPVVSTTEKVRIKSLVDETRLTAVRHGLTAGHSIDTVEDQTNEDDSDDDELIVEENLTIRGSDGEVPADSRHVAMALSKIYESTMSILGDNLAMPTAPVQADDSMALELK